MAVKRIISTSFWSDSKVDTFSPEDKYFMLYLLTNPHTTQLGIYEFSMKHAAFEMGYSVETVQALLSRFQDRYKIIRYCQDTGEIAIKNYLKHSIVKGGKPVLDCLKKELSQVKNKELVNFVFLANQNSENATVREFILYIQDKYKLNDNVNDNDNDNDNERIVDDSWYDSWYDSQSQEEGKSKPPKRKKATAKEDYDLEGFNAFYAAYPRHAGKADALKAWNKLAPDVVLQEQMGKALEVQKQSQQWRKDGGQYIPMPSTWLNGRRWEDEAPQAQSQESQFDRMMAWAKEFDEKHGSV